MTLGRFAILDKMQNHSPDLGDLRSVHRPSTIRLWLMSVIALGLLVPVILGIVLTLDSINSGFSGSKDHKLSGPLVCVGTSSLLFVLFGSFLISDFRKWSATRTVKLTIYQKGFTYENQGRREVCHWDEIKDITHRVVEIRSKHAAPRRVRVIRSVVRKDGEMISLAETLNLVKITKLINNAESE